MQQRGPAGSSIGRRRQRNQEKGGGDRSKGDIPVLTAYRSRIPRWGREGHRGSDPRQEGDPWGDKSGCGIKGQLSIATWLRTHGLPTFPCYTPALAKSSEVLRRKHIWRDSQSLLIQHIIQAQQQSLLNPHLAFFLLLNHKTL